MKIDDRCEVPNDEPEVVHVGSNRPDYPPRVAQAIVRAVSCCIDIGIEDDRRARLAVTLLARAGVCAPGDLVELGAEDFQRRIDQRISELDELAQAEGPLPVEVFAKEVCDGMSMDAVDCAIAGLAMMGIDWRDIGRAMDLAAPCKRADTLEVIAATLALPRTEVELALDRPCLLRREANALGEGENAIHEIRLPHQVERLLKMGNRCVRTVVSMFFRLAGPAELRVDDFAGHGLSLGIVKDYVEGVLARPRKGVNILLHGRPGVGKTQFVRALAEALDARLLEVATGDSDGDPLSPMRRVQSLRASLAAMSRTPRSLIIFDEVEDIFPTGAGFVDSSLGSRLFRSDRHKGWLTNVLEENERPVFWLCNTIEQIEPAYLRRFDLVMEMPGPGAVARRKLVEASFQGIALGDALRNELVNDDSLSPGHLRKISTVLAELQHQPETDVPVSASCILAELRKALRSPPAQDALATIRYRPECVRADTDLDALAEALVTAPGARICLFGPPGTGKTEWVRHAATRMGKQLLVRRGSDLLGPYVGMTEKLVAQAFDEASRRGAMLLIDEADSFLATRTGADQRWQASMTNQFLVSLETFNGYCAVTTNHVDALDSACLRRFDFKVRFDWLDGSQKAVLFGELLEQLGIKDSDEVASERVRRTERLAPGDFATIARQNRVLRLHRNAAAVAEALAKESALKPRDSLSRGRIGFV